MVFYSYAPIAVQKVPLLPHLKDYFESASVKNAQSRYAALSLLQALAERTELPVNFPVLKTEHGRPYFDAENAPDFNLSHSGDLAACILGTCRTGIDIQEELDTLEAEKLTARFFGEREQALMASAPRELFFELWTKKEALSKYLGTGLTPLLKKDTEEIASEHGVRLVSERIFIGGRAYTLSLCAAEPVTFIQI